LVLTMLFGIGMGTWVIGIVSDLLAPRFGTESLKYALLLVAPTSAALAGVCYFWAAKAFAQDMRTAEADGRLHDPSAESPDGLAARPAQA
jgi:hypothetical protein